MTHRPPRPYRRNAGMTLLEVVFAMFILVMVFGAALSSVVQVGRIVAAAKNRTRAVAILNMQMEEMRSMSFGRLQARLAESSFLSGQVTDESLTGTNTGVFRWTRLQDSSAADASASLVKVVVSVEWNDLKGSRTLRSYSYFSKDGVLTAESSPS